MEMGRLHEGEKKDLYLVAFRQYVKGVDISRLVVRNNHKFK